MLEEFFLPRINELDQGDIWFQQDGATVHTSRASMAVLRKHFPERLISIRGDLSGQPVLPICPLVIFYLWDI
ncbi:Transposable element Tc3 transposase [Caligus rogercresseyi]|uniref:Transposable element Tc3 transposase n=1 Tax=Caligus rogercresseyi TaxID=217165 RepID=A0A7T8HMG4_CALRO|nr:Transposable element Tc3 transposase [Caligus rogercresseyi]